MENRSRTNSGQCCRKHQRFRALGSMSSRQLVCSEPRNTSTAKLCVSRVSTSELFTFRPVTCVRALGCGQTCSIRKANTITFRPLTSAFVRRHKTERLGMRALGNLLACARQRCSCSKSKIWCHGWYTRYRRQVYNRMGY